MRAILFAFSLFGSLIGLANGSQSAAARVEWFRRAKYGVFVHYLAQDVMNEKDIHSDFVRRDWNDCVNAFNVERFADCMKRAGAGYVIFTTMQGSQYLVAPNETYDGIYGFTPGEACAQRDLVMDLSDALAKRDIPLMLYFTGDGPLRVNDASLEKKMRSRDGFTTPLPVDFVEKWASVLECYSRRYGKRVSGWWIDGCYADHGNYGYTSEKLRLFERAVHAGNPDGIVAFNNPTFGFTPVMPYVDFEDYTAGEKMDFWALPEKGGRLANGVQWHVASYLGDYWDASGVRYDVSQLGQYVYLTSRNGGVVSIDVMCFWDGGLDRSQINTLSQLRAEIAGWERRAQASATVENLAFLKPSRVLGLDGSVLQTQKRSARRPLNATDGDATTYLQASGEWAWQLETDLEELHDVSCVKVVYRPDSYATRVRVSVSPDRKEWVTVAEQENDDPRRTFVNFDPVRARYVRFAALKPNGAGQVGAQMGIAEIRIYPPRTEDVAR